MVLSKFSVPGRPTNLVLSRARQGLTALALVAGGFARGFIRTFLSGP